jgi:hypothetical protein
MPKPLVELIQHTTADIRAGRESWRVLALLSACAGAITLIVQHVV